MRFEVKWDNSDPAVELSAGRRGWPLKDFGSHHLTGSDCSAARPLWPRDHPPNFTTFWQVVDLAGPLAKPKVQFFTDSLQHLCLCRGESSLQAARCASHSVAVDVQLATNSTGLRLLRGRVFSKTLTIRATCRGAKHLFVPSKSAFNTLKRQYNSG